MCPRVIVKSRYFHIQIAHDLILSRVLSMGLNFQGFEQAEKGIRLISRSISDLLQIECGVLMGANLAPEVASEQFCETTIGKHI